MLKKKEEYFGFKRKTVSLYLIIQNLCLMVSSISNLKKFQEYSGLLLPRNKPDPCHPLSH
jgi:hypothetical protein